MRANKDIKIYLLYSWKNNEITQSTSSIKYLYEKMQTNIYYSTRRSRKLLNQIGTREDTHTHISDSSSNRAAWCVMDKDREQWGDSLKTSWELLEPCQDP